MYLIFFCQKKKTQTNQTQEEKGQNPKEFQLRYPICEEPLEAVTLPSTDGQIFALLLFPCKHNTPHRALTQQRRCLT